METHMTGIAPIVHSSSRRGDQNLRRDAIELLSIALTPPPNDDEVLIENLSELIADSDLRATSMALDMSYRVVHIRGASIIPPSIRADSTYPRAFGLSGSPLLRGCAGYSLLNLL